MNEQKWKASVGLMDVVDHQMPELPFYKGEDQGSD